MIILIPLTLYYLTWNIRFEENVIVKSVFFFLLSRFSYFALREVVKRYYTSERNFTIRMYFVNKKTIQFRMDDENAEKEEIEEGAYIDYFSFTSSVREHICKDLMEIYCLG